MQGCKLAIALAFGLAFPLLSMAADGSNDQDDAATETYLLRYKFKPGEQVRWQVEHRAEVTNTAAGTTQTAETTSRSVKLWTVKSINEAGHFIFVHSVEHVDMRQKVTGQQEVHYDSELHQDPPPGFEQVASAVGVPLTVFTLDELGKVVHREDQGESGEQNPRDITIPLPEEAVPVGHVWKIPYVDKVPDKQGQRLKEVKTQQKFTLLKVDDGIAQIEVETQILTPIHDPMIEAQLIQRASSGIVRFDIQRGRVISQQMDIDKRVYGAHGDGSVMHYVTRFTEDLLTGAAQTASKPAGPEPPQRN